MSKSTMVELIPELGKLTAGGDRSFFINEALNGEFHDFKNKKHACGKVALVSCLDKWVELYPNDCVTAKGIRDDVIDGEYDETADETDVGNMREMVESDPNMTQSQKSKMKQMFGLTVEQNRKSPYGNNYFKNK